MDISGQEIVCLSDICRVCLVKTSNMKNLLDPNEEILQLITQLASLTNLEIEINESLPCFLCHCCEEKLKLSYDFQQLVQKSHQFISACLSATNNLKESNIIKLQRLPNNSEKSDVSSHVETSNSFINFVGSNGLQTEIQDYVADVPVEDKNFEKHYYEVDNFKESKEATKPENNTTIIKSEEDIVPQEVERKTKNNQTMRLAQFSVEEVDKLIRKARERFFKCVNCVHCGFTARDLRSLSVHMTRLHKEIKKQWCLLCNERFDNLNEHMKIVHEDDFKCPLCGKYSTNTSHFLEHLASHSIERKYICKLCEKCFISARHLRKHYRVHSNEKPYSCQICSKGFMLLKSLKSHLRTHKRHIDFNDHNSFDVKNNTEKTVERLCEVDNQQLLIEIKTEVQNFCEKCNKKVRSLQAHNEKFHSDTNEKKSSSEALCAYCGKQFRSRAKLTVHTRIHTGEAPYKCRYCDKRIKTKNHLVVHERTHTGEKPHICNVCGKGFAQSSVLNTHMRRHTGRPEQCTLCPKRFCRSSELRQHMRRHTGELPYFCSYCGQGFNQKSHLVEHIKTHSNERPFQCEFCEKSFRQAGSLKSHINIHLEKKPYKCSQCSYACRQSYSLTQHMSQHENDQPNPDKPHRCGLCGRSFSTLAVFSSHYINQHVPIDEVNIIPDNLGETVKIQGEVMENLEEFVQ